jgi:RimJ/RimL family protein N-acetyltransferase
MIGEETALGKGLAKEAAMLLLDFCDGTLGLESIYLEVKQSNPRARNLYTTLGFSETQVTDSLITMHRRNHALAKLEI